ncbi:MULTISPECIES: acetyl-CoA C-acetyltransferase [Pseudovibrio]|uniref:Acetyl-CoA C-acetyltransferase n=1 Tax=Pseudovibrio brasiliensis TaxID=1898042 RepID=A0ABX8AXP5_9HYPH|nr:MULTISPECIES: acetyl-CoA C-acetyltransferase [Pseudovibrio]EEA93390.1 acetyl-CoA acetyltransferase [Pseudovibrio sp. JE062]QUS58660.1 acetyl-CoA C-acetyltransferase [Pseudovibrio brasiliensis]WNZ53817.1 acetyl-CoA C-acetyltransferase [Microbulbifer sp. MKSA007]
MATTAYVYDAIRTPRSKGKPDGSLNEVKPINLVTTLLDEMQSRHDLDTSRVDDVVMGCVTPVREQGAVLPKIALQKAGWDQTVAGAQVNRFCASGLDTFNSAAARIASGWEDMICAGGYESMSRVPMGTDGGPFSEDPETVLATGFVPQGIGADLIATIEGWSRDDVDAAAVASQQRAAHARDNGWFDKSVVPVKDENGIIVLEKDDFIKPNTDMQALGALRPSFEKHGAMGFDAVALARYPEVEKINHVHTPGNSSGIVDGASLILLGSEQVGKDMGLTPRARVLSVAVTASDPTIMLTGPGPASKKALAKAGLTIDDIDLVEINEAFASVMMRLQKDLNVPDEKLNVVGGAIAMGHPLGATGGMLVSTMIDELERRNQKRALITMCVGGGMGIASIIERV